MLTRRIFLRGSAIVLAGMGAVPSWLARAASTNRDRGRLRQTSVLSAGRVPPRLSATNPTAWTLP